jgi:hypothetical protein
MNKEREAPSLDDVLDFYLISSEETGTDTLVEMIKSYPQYEYYLRELSAFRRLQGLTRGPEYTDEQEASLQARAMSVVQNLLYEQRHDRERSDEHRTLSSLRDEVERQYEEAAAFYKSTDLSEGILWTLDDRQVLFESIPRIAFEKIARALHHTFASIAVYLQGEMQLAASHHKAEASPEATKVTFSDLVKMDDDLTPEQKAYWLSQPPIGPEELA